MAIPASLDIKKNGGITCHVIDGYEMTNSSILLKEVGDMETLIFIFFLKTLTVIIFQGPMSVPYTILMRY